MYTIADFQNPLGITTSLAKRRRLADLAEQYGFWLLEDGPYRALRYWGEELPTLRSLNPGRVLHMASFSKTLAPGLRLGYVIGPASDHRGAGRLGGQHLHRSGLSDAGAGQRILPPRSARAEHRALEGACTARGCEATLAALDKHLPQGTGRGRRAASLWQAPCRRLPADAGLVALADQAGLKLTDGRDFFPNPGRRGALPAHSLLQPDARARSKKPSRAWRAWPERHCRGGDR